MPCRLAEGNSSCFYGHYLNQKCDRVYTSALQLTAHSYICCNVCSLSKECGKVWKEALQLAEGNPSATGTGTRPGQLTASGLLKLDIPAIAKACRNSDLARR